MHPIRHAFEATSHKSQLGLWLCFVSLYSGYLKLPVIASEVKNFLRGIFATPDKHRSQLIWLVTQRSCQLVRNPEAIVFLTLPRPPGTLTNSNGLARRGTRLRSGFTPWETLGVRTDRRDRRGGVWIYHSLHGRTRETTSSVGFFEHSTFRRSHPIQLYFLPPNHQLNPFRPHQLFHPHLTIVT